MPPKIYKIHPSIGIARLGNADADKFFIGPETPGLRATGEPPGTAVPPYKDGGKIKPQAARFRVWEYEKVGSKYAPTREITFDEGDIDKIEWTVHLANRKASFHEFEGGAGERRPPKPIRNAGVPAADRPKKLEIDPGERKILGKNKTGIKFDKGTSANPAAETWPANGGVLIINYLGELRTDDKGRLIVIGGRGKSDKATGAAPIAHYANNDGWFDDASDGPVKAKITIKEIVGGVEQKRDVQALGAWVLVGPPDFAPPVGNIISMYDLLYDVAAREMDLPTDDSRFDGPLKSLKAINLELHRKGRNELKDYQVSFNDEIYPILQRAVDARSLFEKAKAAHVTIGGDPTYWTYLSDPTPAGEGLRRMVFARLRRPPGAPGTTSGDMPRLNGDENFMPADARYRAFVTHTQYSILRQWARGKFVKPSVTPPTPPSGPNITPHGLDQAALENAVGGAFFPGIEASWQIRNHLLFSEPFRLNHAAKSRYPGESALTIGAGHFSRQMALPWQADFLQCRADPPGDYGWWPAQRPDVVHRNAADAAAGVVVAWDRATAPLWPSGGAIPDYDEMLKNWFKFGFVLRVGGQLIETERATSIP